MGSYRARVNLQLMLAKQFLSLSQRGDQDEGWGGQYEQVMLESALFRLLQAYRCHLGDLLETRNISGPCPCNASEAIADLPQDTVVPELEELQDREQFEPWLNLLLGYDYSGQTTAKQGGSHRAELLAVSSDSADLLTLDQLDGVHNALFSLINRHRDTVQEY